MYKARYGHGMDSMIAYIKWKKTRAHIFVAIIKNI